MSFGARLREYRKDMRLSTRALASILKKSVGSINNWEQDKNAPQTLPELTAIADTLGVTMDWLVGRLVLTKWGTDIQILQVSLAAHASSITATDVLHRMVQVVEFCQKQSAVCRQEWFMAGVCGLSMPDFRRFLAKDIDPDHETFLRLAEFTLLPEAWLAEGDVTRLGRSGNLGAYTPFVQRMVADGIAPVEADLNYEWLRGRIAQQRTQ